MSRTRPVARQKRVQAGLPVRLWGRTDAGDPFVEAAHTFNISESGVCLDGVSAPLKVGSIIAVQYCQEKCRFQVIWKQKLKESDEWRIGLRCMDAGPPVWTLELQSGISAEQCRSLLRQALADTAQTKKPRAGRAGALPRPSSRPSYRRLEKNVKRFLEIATLPDEQWETEIQKLLIEGVRDCESFR